MSASLRQRGFTLIELLIVVLVISMLAALLLPALGGAIRRTREAAVTTEENSLAQALTEFKGKYGDYPPSRILLSENGDYSVFPSASYTYASPGANDVNNGALVARSVAAMRKFFPRVQISMSGPIFASPYPTGWYDFDASGGSTPSGPKLLTGDECLVFFLGGMPTVTTSAGKTIYSVTGFGRNPANPFQSSTVTTNRSLSLYEFDSARLVDLDGDGFPSYLDSLKTNKAYAYFSSYGGSGYDPGDCDVSETDDSGTPLMLAFKVNFPVKGGGNAISPPPNPYTSSLTTSSPVMWQKNLTFQIVSAGSDGMYGLGGLYSPDAGTPLPLDTANTTPAGDVTLRAREKDNLVNIHASRLD